MATDAADHLVMSGRRVRLRTTEAGDRDGLVAIRSTPQVHARWGGENLARDFDDDLDDDEVVQLTILFDDRIVGMVQFSEEHDDQYRHASLDIYIDPAVHRQGLATDALRTVIGHLFDERGHHRLTIDPAADNQAAIACYQALGFQPVGVLRAYERQPDGRWADGLLMDLLAADWASLRG